MDVLKFNYDEFKNLVSSICRSIAIGDWKPDYIVGITRGGLLPAVMISHYFKVPCHTLYVSLRDADNIETNCWMSEDAFGYDFNHETPSNPAKRKNILIVDDINDTGATLNYIMKDWEASCMPSEVWNDIWGQNVRFAVIVDNLSSQCSEKMNYSGMEVNKAEKDVWIEFPYESWWK